jgi:hypothetical protein
MDQNMIQKIKLHYRKDLLLHVVAHEGDIITTLKNLNLKDVAFFLLAAWDAVQPKTIRTSWNPLLGKVSILEEESTDIVGDASQEMICSLIKKINPDATVNESDVTEWTRGRGENEFTFKTDDDIVRSVMEVSKDEEEEGKTQVVAITVNHEDAVSHFNHCIKWATENDMPWQQVLLQHLREEGMSKLLQKSKQKKITDFFKKD